MPRDFPSYAICAGCKGAGRQGLPVAQSVHRMPSFPALKIVPTGRRHL